MEMWSRNKSERVVGRLIFHGRYCQPRILRLSLCVRLAIGACIFCGVLLRGQAGNSQSDDANKSWTSTTESRNQNANPMRTVESHTQSGNRTIDKQSVQRRSSDGSYEAYQDIEKETVKMDDGTVRTITRTFNHNANGGKTLVEVTNEEKQTLAGGDSKVVRSTSNPDANGNLQLMRRQVEETKKTSPNVEETKTTVMLPSTNGGLAPAVRLDERRVQGADGTVESQKTTLLPDGAGKWQVGEVRRATTTHDGENRSTEERVSVPDSEGRLGEVSRTLSKATESGLAGLEEKRDTVETYSVSVPGSVGDGKLYMVERAITAQRTASSGQQVTEQQVEQPNPGDPGSGLRVTTVTVDTVRPGASGAQASRTVQARDLNGKLGVISFDNAKSDDIHAIQVQIAPSEEPKQESKSGDPKVKNPPK